MIVDYLKSKISKKDETQKSSKLLPNHFVLNKPILIDESFQIFIKNSVIKLPLSVTTTGYVQWMLDGIDSFEDIILDSHQYKFLYDKTNDTLYFLQLIDTSNREDINNTSVHIGQNVYEQVTDVMEVSEKHELLRIYEREISHDTSEYLFVEMGRKMLQKCWAGVIIELSLLN